MSNNEQYAERETSLDPIRLREFDNREGQDPTPTRSQLFEHSPIRMALEGLRPTAWSGAVSEPVGDDGGIDGGEDDEVVRVNIFDTILAKLLDTFDAMCMHMDQPATSEDQVDKCHRSLQGLRTARTLCIQAIGRPLTDTLDAIPGRRTAVKTILGQLTLLVGDQTEPSKYHEYSQSLKEAMRCDSRHLFGGSYIMTIISNEDFWTREVEEKIGSALAGNAGVANAQTPCLALFEQLIRGDEGLLHEISMATFEFRQMRRR